MAPKKKGIKLGLGDFLGPSAVPADSFLPNAPKQRDAGDDAPAAAAAAPVNSRAAGLGVDVKTDGNNNVTSVRLSAGGPAQQGQPPKVNSRIAGLMDEEREHKERRMKDLEARSREMEITGPAPVVQNSRFAAAAALDEANR
ncbi:hypothetical protein TrRE_jg1949, partial [Triparma retinervis]